MSQAVAWMDGEWSSPDELSIPVSDRGLRLADGVFETILTIGSKPQLLSLHLERWRTGAELLAMQPPPQESDLEPLLVDAITRAQLRQGSGALRLNWSRGSTGGRGLAHPTSGEERFWLTLDPCEPEFKPVTTIISSHERRNADSRLSRCKTFAYGQAVLARQEALAAGMDDALLLDTNGELCCSTSANLLVCRHGAWLTPPLSSGCLPGVMRARALATGLCREAWIGASLKPTDQALLINSLGCREIQSVNGTTLIRPSQSQTLWANLLL